MNEEIEKAANEAGLSNLSGIRISAGSSVATPDLSNISQGFKQGEASWPSDPLPIRRAFPASLRYPVEALDTIAPAASRLREIVQAPLDLCGQSILAAASLVTQGHADVIIDGRQHPISENFVTIAESGERKSTIDRVALREVRNRQRELEVIEEAARAAHEKETIIYERKREVILKKLGKRSTEEIDAELLQLGLQPVPPLGSTVIMEEPTYEGLVKSLARGQPSVGLFSDEGGRLLGGYSMSPENQTKTATGLSQLWDGKPVDRVRGGDGVSVLYGRRLSMHLMIQPVLASTLFNNGMLTGQGFLARALTCFPDSTIGTRMYKIIDVEQDSTLLGYHERLRDILRVQASLAEGKRNELNPRQLGLSPQAKMVWIVFHDEIERELRPDGSYCEIRPLGAKAAEHAARLAATLMLLRDIDSSEITGLAMECGVELARFYLAEALRMRRGSVDDPDLILAERLLSWLQSRSSRFVALVDIYQRGPNQVRDKKTALRIVRILEEHFWIRRGASMEIEGRKRQEVWEIRGGSR